MKRTPGPLLYRQQRLGEHGRIFTMLKFRSMRTDAEAAGVTWAVEDNHRIIPGGRLMRRLRLPFWSQRHLLKPGITGWAQIRSGYAADAMATIEKLSHDLWYLRHRSVLLDALICVQTLPRMATFRGGAR